MLLNILQAPDSPSEQRIIEAKTPLVLRLRHPHLGGGPNEEEALSLSLCPKSEAQQGKLKRDSLFRQMKSLEPCLLVPSEALPLIREGRKAGALSAVEWEGDSWACV